jgi:hypothetical protein
LAEVVDDVGDGCGNQASPMAFIFGAPTAQINFASGPTSWFSQRGNLAFIAVEKSLRSVQRFINLFCGNR